MKLIQSEESGWIHTYIYFAVIACVQGCRDGRLILDPSTAEAEAAACEGSVTVAALSATGELAGVFVEGHLGEHLGKAVQLAMAACKQTRTAVRDVLVENRESLIATKDDMDIGEG